MEQRPHLVIDGALLAAGAVGAREVVLYVGAEHAGAIRAMQRAVDRTSGTRARPAPPRERAGALRLGRGDRRSPLRQLRHRAADIHPAASVRTWDRRPSDARAERRDARARGAHRALRRRVVPLARGWRRLRDDTRSPSAARFRRRCSSRPPQGTTITEAVNAAGGLTSDSDAVLLGGYFGGWVASSTAWGLRHRRRAAACRWLFARLRDHRRASGRTLWRRGDGEDPRLSRARERAPVRPVHLRTARDRSGERARRGSHLDRLRP